MNVDLFAFTVSWNMTSSWFYGYSPFCLACGLKVSFRSRSYWSYSIEIIFSPRPHHCNYKLIENFIINNPTTTIWHRSLFGFHTVFFAVGKIYHIWSKEVQSSRSCKKLCGGTPICPNRRPRQLSKINDNRRSSAHGVFEIRQSQTRTSFEVEMPTSSKRK